MLRLSIFTLLRLLLGSGLVSFWEWLITVLLVDLLPFVSPAVALYDVLTKRVDNSKCLCVALIIICCWMRVGGAHLPLAAKKLLEGVLAYVPAQKHTDSWYLKDESDKLHERFDCILYNYRKRLRLYCRSY